LGQVATDQIRQRRTANEIIQALTNLCIGDETGEIDILGEIERNVSYTEKDGNALQTIQIQTAKLTSS
jgi:hypothetical protein